MPLMVSQAVTTFAIFLCLHLRQTMIVPGPAFSASKALHFEHLKDSSSLITRLQIPVLLSDHKLQAPGP